MRISAFKYQYIYLLMFIFVLAGCEETEEGLDGTWQASGCLDENEAGDCEFSWYHEYTFKDKDYQMTGYPPIEESGTFEVLQRSKKKFQIELRPSDPDLMPETQDIIKYNEDSIAINGAIYYRVKSAEEE